MKLFVIGLGSSFDEHTRVVKELSRTHDIQYWIWLTGGGSQVDKSQFPKTVFHDYHDALKGVPADAIDTSGFLPWSAERIRAFSSVETELMSMMDKWYPNWPVNQRKELYYELLRYWSGVLDRFKPEWIIFPSAPHQLFDFVLYEIAKKSGIQTLMLDIALNQDRIIIYDDFREGNKQLRAMAQKGFGEIRHDDLSAYMRSYYEEISSSRNPVPPYVADFKETHKRMRWYMRRARALVPYIQDGTIVERAVQRIFKLLKNDSKDEYQACERSADFSKPFVYVPLHFQPECTTSPQGGIYVDQMLMVKTLSAALPLGWELYVKEHPAQWTAHGRDFTPQRYPGFYKEIAALPNVRLVPITINTFELADHARTTATITGMAGWESVMRGKTALIFGYPWFMHAPGVFRVSSVQACAQAFERVAGGYMPKREKLYAYLDALDKNTCKGFLSSAGVRVATYSKEEHFQDLTQAIQTALIP